MSDLESNPAQAKTPAPFRAKREDYLWGVYPSIAAYRPNFGSRILLWAGIYLGGAAPTVLLSGKLGALVVFPWGLAFALTSVMLKSWTDGWGDTAVGFAYGFYLVHLVLSLIIPSARVFRILMIILIVVVVINLGGCVEWAHQASQHHWSLAGSPHNKVC